MIWIVTPRMREKIWGSVEIVKQLGFSNPNNKLIGEILLLSALPGEESNLINTNDKYSGPLTQIFNNYPKLFFQQSFPTFPLLLKILCPAQDLSLQVHPTDEYAQKFENEPFGKEESWVCLSSRTDQHIIYGHRINSAIEFELLQQQGRWNEIITPTKITRDTLVNISPGTVHAVLANTIVYELQQNSNLTYRLYDYERLSNQGLSRDLHVKKALANIYYPQRQKPEKKIQYCENKLKLELINRHYLLYSVKVSAKFVVKKLPNCYIGTIIDGSCIINSDINVHKYQTFIISRQEECAYEFVGNAKILFATVNEEQKKHT